MGIILKWFTNKRDGRVWGCNDPEAFLGKSQGESDTNTLLPV
jgi:hypothetical protein